MMEKTIEQSLVRKTKEKGGLALKFVSPGMSGVPDRLILFPFAHIGFVELKAPGQKMRPLQLRRKAQLERLGFRVYCIDRMDQIEEVLDEIRSS